MRESTAWIWSSARRTAHSARDLLLADDACASPRPGGRRSASAGAPRGCGTAARRPRCAAICSWMRGQLRVGPDQRLLEALQLGLDLLGARCGAAAPRPGRPGSAPRPTPMPGAARHPGAPTHRTRPASMRPPRRSPGRPARASAATACSASGPCTADVDLHPERRHQGQQAHDALAVGLLAVLADLDLGLELAGQLHELHRRAGVQPQLVADPQRPPLRARSPLGTSATSAPLLDGHLAGQLRAQPDRPPPRLPQLLGQHDRRRSAVRSRLASLISIGRFTPHSTSAGRVPSSMVMAA